MATETEKAIRLKKFHGWSVVAWAVLMVPSVLWWKDSILWVIILSVAANLLGSFSAWQASRAEVSGEDNTEEIKGTRCKCCGNTR